MCKGMDSNLCFHNNPGSPQCLASPRAGPVRALRLITRIKCTSDHEERALLGEELSLEIEHSSLLFFILLCPIMFVCLLAGVDDISKSGVTIVKIEVRFQWRLLKIIGIDNLHSFDN